MLLLACFHHVMEISPFEARGHVGEITFCVIPVRPYYFVSRTHAWIAGKPPLFFSS